MEISDNEENPSLLWAEILKLRAEIAGPDGYATWKDAAVAEKLRAEALARAVMADMGNQREPLTELQIDALVQDVYSNSGHMQPTPAIIVRAIERAHGIGA